MPAIFVHVSDIHFGQERDHALHIHNDVKRQLIEDAAEVVATLPGGVAHGILATGDIAFSGTAEQYLAAGAWLDELAGRIGCPIHQVQMVPGNHDLDRKKLSVGGGQLLDYIRNGGAAEYEKVIADQNDRATLLARFEEYGKFSIGYQCGLDDEAKFATNLRMEVGPGRWIRFVRLNSSLLCSGSEGDEHPELMIGARQFTLPRTPGEENIVLVHHPLHWYKDAEEVRQYVRSRSRMFVSGHEHNPKVEIDTVSEGCDVLMLASGAAVPSSSNEIYTYTYNVVVFDWDEGSDALAVTVYPRAWNPTGTCFEADEKRLGGKDRRFLLGSPNFRKVGAAVKEETEPANSALNVSNELAGKAAEAQVAEIAEDDMSTMPRQIDGYELALLRFFRDLVESERLRILVDLDAIPRGSDERMTQGVERKLFDWLAGNGQLSNVVEMTSRMITERTEKKHD